MNTENFIHHFLLRERSTAHQHSSKIEKTAFWIHQHPTVTKTLEAAGGIFGICSILSLPVSLPSYGFVAVLTAVTGGIIGLASLAAYKALDILIPPNHTMQRHVFKPSSYGSGRLYYQGDVPILELNYDHPYQAGKAHGYLLGGCLHKLITRLEFIKKIAHLPKAEDMPKVMAEIQKTIPADFLEEMKGLVDGFRHWSLEKGLNIKKFTLEDLILLHLMPDSIHFSPEQYERNNRLEKEQKAQPTLGCTVVIDQDSKEGFVFGRNMDWPSFGIFGSYSLMINRRHPLEKFSTLEVGLPGFVGAITGMNSKGLSLAQNVCSGYTHEINGMPAAFFNRFCLETCQSVDECLEKINQHPPLGSYHLSIADKTAAKSVHLFQGENKAPHVIREWTAGTPLITTNCNYSSDGQQFLHMHHSQERHAIIQKLFNEATANLSGHLERGKLVRASSALPYVDNILTTHKVVMNPESKKMQVAFNNGFGGASDLQELDTRSLLYEPRLSQSFNLNAAQTNFFLKPGLAHS